MAEYSLSLMVTDRVEGIDGEQAATGAEVVGGAMAGALDPLRDSRVPKISDWTDAETQVSDKHTDSAGEVADGRFKSGGHGLEWTIDE